MSVMSDRYAEIEDVKEGFLDYVHTIFDAEDVERALSSDELLEQVFGLYLSRARTTALHDPDVLHSLSSDASPVLNRVGP